MFDFVYLLKNVEYLIKWAVSCTETSSIKKNNLKNLTHWFLCLTNHFKNRNNSVIMITDVPLKICFVSHFDDNDDNAIKVSARVNVYCKSLLCVFFFQRFSGSTQLKLNNPKSVSECEIIGWFERMFNERQCKLKNDKKNKGT